MRAGRATKKQARRDHFRVIEHHQGAGRKFLCEMTEYAFADLTVAINQQFRRIALREGIFGDPLVGKRIRIILNMKFGNHDAKLMLFTVGGKPEIVNICEFSVNFRRVYKCFINRPRALFTTGIRKNDIE